jgi:hypothetical protein
MSSIDPTGLPLAQLRRELETVHPPAALEGVLRARFRREHFGDARPRLWWMPPLALAATLAVVSWIVHAPIAAIAPAEATAPSDSDAGPFLALKPLERIALEPATTVVATEFPRALLAEWGLPVSPERAGEPVRAEMLYSADGEPLAVRLVN